MAQTAGIINATDIRIYVAAALIAHTTSAELSVSADMIDITTKDSAGWNEGMPGKKSWEMSGEGKFSFDAAYSPEDLFAALLAKTKLAVKYKTATSGNDEYSGDCYVTSWSVSAGVEDATSFSFTFTGTGAIAKAVTS
jgi:TP901-1 family phage major tail protein